MESHAGVILRRWLGRLIGLCLGLSLSVEAGVTELSGNNVTLLPNGNMVVTDPDHDGVMTANIGQVILYDPDGNVISTITGFHSGDRIGSGGITVLANGNFVIHSPDFRSYFQPTEQVRGAVTWGSQMTGVSGNVSETNSVILGTGSLTTRIEPLSTGHYVVTVPKWSSYTDQNLGAVTFCDGTQPTARLITSENSLIGSQANDQVGSHGVVEVADGNYVVSSRSWANGAVGSAGAVTWCSGTTGRFGMVSAENSLVGTTSSDQVGSVLALKNGHYVVVSSLWDRGGIQNAGAVTWGDGRSGITGAVSVGNSLVGSHQEDSLGTNGILLSVVPLTHGDYVVISPRWDSGSILDAGAVSWCPGEGGAIGVVTDAVTLTGSEAFDLVGSRGIREVGGGNYVVCSPEWHDDRGAVTWVDGQSGLKEVVSAQNSLVGSSAGNLVGYGGTGLLTNGNYLVVSPFWDNGSATDAGAVTWASAEGGIVGSVSAANSLVGSTAMDYVGASSIPNIVPDIGGVVVTQPSTPLVPVVYLPNGNYVVACPNWDNGSLVNAGAAVWGDGSQGVNGVITASNALVGLSSGQRMGKVKALSNSHYVVCSPGWRTLTGVVVGAYTWCDGSIGRKGVVTAANSLTGTEAARASDGEVTALTNGHYVIVNPEWGDRFNLTTGAVTWCDGSQGGTGVISQENSMTGFKTGSKGVVPLPQGDYLILSPAWPVQDWFADISGIGAVTWCDGSRPTSGKVTAENSVYGTFNDQAFGSLFEILNDGSCLFTTRGLVAPNRRIVWLTGTGEQNGPSDLFSHYIGDLDQNFSIRDNTLHGKLVLVEAVKNQITMVDMAPALNSSRQGLASNADTLILRGAGFSLIPGENQILFDDEGVSGIVTAATATELTVTGLVGLRPGPLMASVVGGFAEPVQVATVYDPSPGSVSFATSERRVGREFSEVLLTLVREEGGLPCSVTLQTVNGESQKNPPFSPALVNVDFLSPSVSTLDFAEGELVKTVRIQLLPQKNAHGPNKHFKVRLIDPEDSVVLGTVPEVTVQIITDDFVPPTLKLLTKMKDVSAALPWRISGVAGDKGGIDRVMVYANNELPVMAMLDRTKPTSVPFNVDLVFDAQNVDRVHLRLIAYDLTGNSTEISASTIFTERQRLTVHRVVPESFASTPDKAAKISLTAQPTKAASALKAMAKSADTLISDILPGTAVTLRAIPLSGNGFELWEGLPEEAVIEEDTVHFVMPGTPVNITTYFSANPFSPPIGRGLVFHGLLHSAEGTDSTNETEGYFTGTMVAKTGAFSGRILIGGVNQPVTAVFQRNGTGLFKVGKIQVDEFVFGSRRLSLSYNATTDQDAIAVTVANDAGMCEGMAHRTYYDGKQRKVPAELLNSTSTGFYTLVLPAREQSGFLPTEYPQGSGYASVKLTNTGLVAYTGTLADGTVVTASTALTEVAACPLFIPLTIPGAKSSIKGGSFSGRLGFAPGASDNITGTDLLWFRPAVTEVLKPAAAVLATQLYTQGWPEGITLNGYGSLNNVKVPVQTTLGLGEAMPEGNALLVLDGGRLTDSVEISNFSIQSNKVVKVYAADKSFTLSVSASKGTFSGTFTPDWSGAAKKLPLFKGVLIQQGTMRGGHGFFISNAEADADPESGSVELGAP